MDSDHELANDGDDDVSVSALPPPPEAVRLLRICVQCETVFVDADNRLTRCPNDHARLVPHEERDKFRSIDEIAHECVRACVSRVSSSSASAAVPDDDETATTSADTHTAQHLGRCLDENLNISPQSSQVLTTNRHANRSSNRHQNALLDEIRRKSHLGTHVEQVFLPLVFLV